ncbi:DUF1918 domain-containing protein [Thermobifida halotolerans]|uniref:DUF1918 domain-containing protein n=1 Tax=Thermobifida halotolerans TaxID=483545 RepID=A0AA97M0V7_9ACTN|nr:dsRBD fold-containing protein [Thermobifida halotolerans]UOE21755.1 DUF1918 domain-containing protein [Thermobifida halotolerans]
MRAQVGDRLVVEGPRDDLPAREGVVIAIRGRDGAPPYRVRWLDDGRETLLYPGPDAHVKPAVSGRGEDVRTDLRPMHTAKRWNVDVVVSEENEDGSVRTLAEARPVSGEWANLRGHGEARKHPEDVDVPEIGDELAVSRALSDLAHKLRQVAADDIVDRTGTPWQPT